MGRRQVIDISPVRHGAPISTAVRIDNMLFTSAVYGGDPETGEIPGTVEQQTAFVFANIRRILDAAGGSPADIGHCNVFVEKSEHRDVVNEHWLEMFPDPDDRPARHVVVQDLPGPLFVQVELVAVLE